MIRDLGMRLEGTKNRRYGIFKCEDCFREKEMRVDLAKASKTGFCRKCSSKYSKVYHGDTNTKLYHVWASMKHRALSENIYSGISICDEWTTWANFKEWALTSGYKEGLSIDRVDNDSDYSPSNCRWTTQVVQNQNTRLLNSKNTSGYRGLDCREDREYCYVFVSNNGKRINLGKFYDKIEAAKAYDRYIVDNNLHQPINFKRSDYE